MDFEIGISGDAAVLKQLVDLKINEGLVKQLSEKILGYMQHRPCELSIHFCSASDMQELNRQYREKDTATDVLSFSQIENQQDEPEVIRIEGLEILGDVVICPEIMFSQAEDAGVSVLSECSRLLIHGILHLLGYEHVHGGEEEKIMQRYEEEIQAFLER